MLNNEEKIKQWGNSSRRREFIQNYRSWDVWFAKHDLGLIFYKFELIPQKWLVAMEYKSGASFNDSDWYRGVIYYIHKPDGPFVPFRRQEYELMELLKKEKMRLLAEKRAASGK